MIFAFDENVEPVIHQRFKTSPHRRIQISNGHGGIVGVGKLQIGAQTG